jgi:small subunit ribosomal protein S14
MAKLSILARNSRRRKAATRAKNSRNELREMIKDPNLNYETKSTLVEKLNKKPRNESPIRVQKRCRSCGRSRAVYRKFGICRLCLRLAAMRGDVPGLLKASW